MIFTVWHKKTAWFLQSVPESCFLRLETGTRQAGHTARQLQLHQGAQQQAGGQAACRAQLLHALCLGADTGLSLFYPVWPIWISPFYPYM